MWFVVAIVLGGAMLIWLLRRGRDDDRLAPSELTELATPVSEHRNEASRYFSLFPKIDQLKKAREYEKALAVAWDALRDFSSVADDIGVGFRSPPFDYVCTHAVLTRDRAMLDRMQDVLSQGRSQHLAPFEPRLAEYQDTLSIFTRVFDHIKSNPGALQRSLGKVLDEDGRTISKWIKRAEKRGIIRREVSGKTYGLYVADG